MAEKKATEKKATAKQKHRMQITVKHNGKVYPEGEEVELTEKVAALFEQKGYAVRIEK